LLCSSTLGFGVSFYIDSPFGLVFRPYFGAFEMTGLAEQIKLLYDSKLYSNVVALVSKTREAQITTGDE
jgi:hypothetical protein